MQTLSPDTQYVPWDVFEWIIGMLITWGAAHSLRLMQLSSLKSRFDVHVKATEKRIDELVENMEKRHAELTTQLALEHAENKGNLQQTRADLLAGQSNMTAEVHILRQSMERLIFEGKRAP